jgi:hypothetical protein
MGFLSRLFGGKKQAASGSPPDPSTSTHGDDELLSTANDVECPHIDLGPHWENAADMGHDDKVTGYRCGGCLRLFSVEETRVLRETEATRLAWMKEGKESTVAPASDAAAVAQPDGTPPAPTQAS